MISREFGGRLADRQLMTDLVCACAAGLCAGTYSFLIYLLKPREFNITAYLRYTLTALIAYLAVALILHRFWKEGLRRLLPSWILISVFGSIFFAVLRLLPAVIGGWSGPTVTAPYLAEYMTTEVSAARSVVILLSLLTLPITALIYYGGSIRRAVKRWHNGTDSPPSILNAPSPRRRSGIPQ